jgi:hypothetical protein
MSTPAAPVLRDIKRGAQPDMIEFTLTDGSILIAHAHGVHTDERLRTREALLKVLTHRLPRSRRGEGAASAPPRRP